MSKQKKDRLAVELERAIHNWVIGGCTGPEDAIQNIFRLGYEEGMKVYLPVFPTRSLVEDMGNPEDVKEGDTFTARQDVHIGIHMLPANPPAEDKTYIPIFTSLSELQKGESQYSLGVSFKDALAAVQDDPGCIGFVINPWGESCVYTWNVFEQVLQNPTHSFVSFVPAPAARLHAAIKVKPKESLTGPEMGMYEIWDRLDEAKASGKLSVAIPGYPLLKSICTVSEAAEGVLYAVFTWLKQEEAKEDTPVINIYIACETEEQYNTYMDQLYGNEEGTEDSE